MSEGILIALIGAGAVIIAAVIGLIGKNITNSSNRNVKIKQSSKGNTVTQVGIQNITKKDKDEVK